MKKIFTGLLLTSVLWTASPADAATPQLMIDEVVVKTDAAPEVKNNRTMVPLRVISENLGAQVQWKDSQITLTMNQSTVLLTLNSQTVMKNGKASTWMQHHLLKTIVLMYRFALLRKHSAVKLITNKVLSLLPLSHYY